MKNFLTSRKRKKFLTSSIMKNSWILRMAKYFLTSRKNEFNNCHCLLHIKFKIPPIHFTSCCTTSNRRNILIKSYLMYLYIFFLFLISYCVHFILQIIYSYHWYQKILMVFISVIANALLYGWLTLSVSFKRIICRLRLSAALLRPHFRYLLSCLLSSLLWKGLIIHRI